MSNFKERLRTLENVFVGQADIKHAFRQMHIPWLVASVFCAALCSRIRSWLHGKTIDQKRLAHD